MKSDPSKPYIHEVRRQLTLTIVRRTLMVICLFSIPIFALLAPSFLPISPWTTLLGCILLAPDISGFMSSMTVDLIFNRREAEVIPMYGIPDSLATKGNYEAAEREYEKIIEEFPGEIRPHISMITIAVQHLKDLELADRLYSRGMDLIEDADKQRQLEKIYEDLRSIISDDGDSISQVTDLTPPE